MTRAELDALPERELDALVATLILGWQRVDAPNGRGGTYEAWVTDQGGTVPVGDHWPQRYSTDLNATRIVLKKATELKSASSDPEDHAYFRLLAELSEILGVKWDNGSIGAGQLLEFITATPRQLMTAVLLAWERKR